LDRLRLLFVNKLRRYTLTVMAQFNDKLTCHRSSPKSELLYNKIIDYKLIEN